MSEISFPLKDLARRSPHKSCGNISNGTIAVVQEFIMAVVFWASYASNVASFCRAAPLPGRIGLYTTVGKVKSEGGFIAAHGCSNVLVT